MITQLLVQSGLDSAWLDNNDLAMKLPNYNSDLTSPYTYRSNEFPLFEQFDPQPADASWAGESGTGGQAFEFDQDFDLSQFITRTISEESLETFPDLNLTFNSTAENPTTTRSGDRPKFAMSPPELVSDEILLLSPKCSPEIPRRNSNSSDSAAASTERNTAKRKRKAITNKAAHNEIEKRYRNKINAQFSALNSALPPPPPLDNSDNECSKNSLTRRNSKEQYKTSTVSQQRNKSQVLTTALRYINQLEHQNGRLHLEIKKMKYDLLPTWRY